MELQKAACPECRAAIEVSLDLDETTCPNCGAAISPREAVDRALEPGAAVLVANHVLRARQAMEQKEFARAFRFFQEALVRQPTNADALQGSLLAATRGLTKVDYAWAALDGDAGLPALARAYLACTPRSRRKEAAGIVWKTAGLLRADLSQLNAVRTAALRRCRFSWLLAAALAALAVAMVLVPALPFTAVFAAAAAVPAVRAVVLRRRAERTAASISPVPIETLKECLARVEAVFAGEAPRT